MRRPFPALAGFIVAAVTRADAVPLQAQATRQTDADHYTRYELLAPGSAKFRIIYEVTATTAGAKSVSTPAKAGLP